MLLSCARDMFRIMNYYQGVGLSVYIRHTSYKRLNNIVNILYLIDTSAYFLE
jgi:hypothetical protein